MHNLSALIYILHHRITSRIQDQRQLLRLTLKIGHRSLQYDSSSVTSLSNVTYVLNISSLTPRILGLVLARTVLACQCHSLVYAVIGIEIDGPVQCSLVLNKKDRPLVF